MAAATTSDATMAVTANRRNDNDDLASAMVLEVGEGERGGISEEEVMEVGGQTRELEEGEGTRWLPARRVYEKVKKSQTEMDGVATMRNAEKRKRTRRSGKNPELEGVWEGSAKKLGVKRVQWEELTRSQRKRAKSVAKGRSLGRSWASQFRKGEKSPREAEKSRKEKEEKERREREEEERKTRSEKRRRDERREEEERRNRSERRRRDERKAEEERRRKDRKRAEEERRGRSERAPKSVVAVTTTNTISPAMSTPRMDLEKRVRDRHEEERKMEEERRRKGLRTRRFEAPLGVALGKSAGELAKEDLEKRGSKWWRDFQKDRKDLEEELRKKDVEGEETRFGVAMPRSDKGEPTAKELSRMVKDWRGHGWEREVIDLKGEREREAAKEEEEGAEEGGKRKEVEVVTIDEEGRESMEKIWVATDSHPRFGAPATPVVKMEEGEEEGGKEAGPIAGPSGESTPSVAMKTERVYGESEGAVGMIEGLEEALGGKLEGVTVSPGQLAEIFQEAIVLCKEKEWSGNRGRAREKPESGKGKGKGESKGKGDRSRRERDSAERRAKSKRE